MRFGLKRTLRCVIWVKSWKLEALIWAGSAVIGIIIARDATSSSSENSFISNSFQGNFNERRLMLQMLKLHFEMPLAATSSSLQLFSKSKEIFSNLKKNTEDYFYTIYALAQSNHHDAIYGKICSFVMICICICIYISQMRKIQIEVCTNTFFKMGQFFPLRWS